MQEKSIAESASIEDPKVRLAQEIAARPESAQAHYELGKLLSMRGRHDEALLHLEKATRLRADWPEALNSLAIVLIGNGKRDAAEAALRKALAARPGFAEAHCNLANLLSDSNRLQEAETAFRHALDAAPGFEGARLALAKLFVRASRIDEAAEQLQIVLESAPTNADAHHTLGKLYLDSDRLDEALAPLRKACELSPDDAHAHAKLGVALYDLSKWGEAEPPLRRALELDEDINYAWVALGIVLRVKRKLDESEAAIRRALANRPNYAAAHVELGNVLLAKNSGDIESALRAFHRATEIDPAIGSAHSNLSYSRYFNCEDGFQLLAEARRFNAHHEAELPHGPLHFDNDRSRSRRLRVGYVSPDFRQHCQSLFMTPLLTGHDHDVVEVFCYFTSRNEDDTTRHLKTCADEWRDVHRLSDDELADQIRADRIDVLFDLTMHMSACRPRLFALRPAPVQIAWLAYPGTTGSKAIGYRLTDPWLDPVDASNGDARYSEKSIRLPDTFWCYDPLTTEPQVSPLPADDAGFITFGCLNNPYKLTDRTFALWAAVLREVPLSRLRLLVAHGEARASVASKFAALGIDPERVIFTDYQPRNAYLRSYREIDIALDTFPYNGHTTSLDGLWMGVPMLTIIGRTPASRAGYALLSNVGLPELAADSDAGFVAKAAALATDLPRLRDLRAGLRARMESSPLMDGARFARGIEQAIRTAWADWCDSDEAARV
ncbi:O-linked N-acetylglucosamine transferase, SPINDLY family protein [Caballeronia glebae]|uniref:O-linked N-acetylglucosamine transferase, SPINDLY family protein n=1 Tax=Caballeronia glebae TaxID=1777143 RepID=UPI0038B7B454